MKKKRNYKRGGKRRRRLNASGLRIIAASLILALLSIGQTIFFSVKKNPTYADTAWLEIAAVIVIAIALCIVATGGSFRRNPWWLAAYAAWAAMILALIAANAAKHVAGHESVAATIVVAVALGATLLLTFYAAWREDAK